MNILVVYCHPVAESFSAAIRDTAVEALQEAGHQVRLLDLYADGFDPVMGCDERRAYHTRDLNEAPVADHLALLRESDGLLFVYPTWWYGLPAMLKGWLDRVWVPHATFTLPEDGRPIRPLMTHIRFLGAVTTCGAPWWWSKFVGEPGRRTILRGIRALCARRCRTFWLAHYEMDSSTAESRAAFLARLQQKLVRVR